MAYNNQPDSFTIAIYVAMALLKPLCLLLIVGAVLWVVARFLVDLCSWDGGHGRREQRQRHRLQILVLGAALACGTTGVVMTTNGYAEGAIIIDLPGGMKIHGGGMAAVFTAGMLFILWALMQMLVATREKVEKGRVIDHTAAAQPIESRASEQRINLAPAHNLVHNMTYVKAGTVTIVLLPFLGPIALLPGGFLAYKAWQKRNPQIRLSLPPRE